MEIFNVNDANLIPGIAHSSKGNQLKWHIDDYWYKADGLGYEGLAEVVSSCFLRNFNIRFLNESGIEFVKYEPVIIIWKESAFWGCKSVNFRQEGWQLITLEKLFRRFTGFSLAKEIMRFSEISDRITFTVDFVRNVTGLDDFGKYLSTLLNTDAFFFNEDRHTNNIAVLYNPSEERFDYCPYFDYGAGLFSDAKGDYPLNLSVEECIKLIAAKPFCDDFDIQADEASRLYKESFAINCSKNILIDEWKRIRKEYEDVLNYELPSGVRFRENITVNLDLALNRVEDVIYYQIRKYFIRNK